MKALTPRLAAEYIYHQISTEYNNEKAKMLSGQEVEETLKWLTDEIIVARILEAESILLFSFEIDLYSGKLKIAKPKSEKKENKEVKKLRKENWFGEFEDPNL